MSALASLAPFSVSRSRVGGIWQPRGFLVLAAAMGVAFAKLPLILSVVLLVGVSLLLLVIIYPLFGVALLLLAGPLGALENVVFGSLSVGSGQLLLILTMGAWLAGGLARKRVLLPKTRLNLPLAIFVGAAAVTVPDAPSTSLGVKELLKWVEIFLTMFLVVDLVNRSGFQGRRARLLTLGTLLLAGASQAIVGIWQFGLRDGGPGHFGILGSYFRAYGTFEQPNPFGGFVSLSAFLAIGAFAGLLMDRICSRRGGECVGERETNSYDWQGTLGLAAVGTCALLCTLALLFSWSRGAWLGFAVGIASLALFLPKRIWTGAAVLVLLAAVGGGMFLVADSAGIVPSGIVERVTNLNQGVVLTDVRGVDINDSNFSVLERLAHWQAAIDMARDHPWFGVGFGNYEAAYGKYALINWPQALGHAHNYYLNLLAEVGLIGLSMYLLFWLAVFWQTIRMTRRHDWPERGIALGLLAAWTAFSVHHLVDKLYVNNIYLQLGVMFALLHQLDTNEENGELDDAMSRGLA